MLCMLCERNEATVEVSVGYGEYEMWCEHCRNTDAFYDKHSKEWVAEDCQAVWRRSEDISDSGDFEDVCPDWAEDNLVYCNRCDCYVSPADWDENKKSCKWCATKATQRTAETQFEEVPLEYAEENLAYCKKCNSYVESDKWNAKAEMCKWCSKEIGR